MTSKLRAAEVARLRAIDFRVTFLGELSRQELARQLKVGGASVTRDIACYKDKLGARIELDPKTKSYRPAPDFRPLYKHDVELVLRTLTRGFGGADATKPTDEALVSSAFPPAICLPNEEILAKVSRAIHGGYPLRIRYHSFNSGGQERIVVPIALADNGMRWHARVFDRNRNKFIDLVLTRIESAEELSQEPVLRHEKPEHDHAWNRVIELELVPHPKEPRPEVIRMDYPMRDGVFRVRVRAALASYLLRQWIVDCSSGHHLDGVEYRLWLRNTPILYSVSNAHLAPGYDGPTIEEM